MKRLHSVPYGADRSGGFSNCAASVTAESRSCSWPSAPETPSKGLAPLFPDNDVDNLSNISFGQHCSFNMDPGQSTSTPVRNNQLTQIPCPATTSFSSVKQEQQDYTNAFAHPQHDAMSLTSQGSGQVPLTPSPIKKVMAAIESKRPASQISLNSQVCSRVWVYQSLSESEIWAKIWITPCYRYRTSSNFSCELVFRYKVKI